MTWGWASTWLPDKGEFGCNRDFLDPDRGLLSKTSLCQATAACSRSLCRTQEAAVILKPPAVRQLLQSMTEANLRTTETYLSITEAS